MIPPVAYIEPGTGSLVIQAAIAAIVAVPIFLRSQIARVFHALRRGRDDESAAGRGGDVGVSGGRGGDERSAGRDDASAGA